MPSSSDSSSASGSRRASDSRSAGGPLPHRAARRVVWLLVAVNLGLLTLAAVVHSTYRAPDEFAHVDLALTLLADPAYPVADELTVSEAVLVTRRYVGRADDEVLSRPAPPRSERPAFGELAAAERSGQMNQMPQHPPGYYYLASAVLAGWGAVGDGVAEAPFDRVVVVLRMLSAVLVAGLPWWVWKAARLATDSETVALTAAAASLGVPMLTHIGASVNNDALLIATFGVLAVGVARVARGCDSPATAVWVGLAAAAALLSKGFALVAGPWIVAAYALQAWRGRRWRESLRRGAVAVALPAGLAGWWYVRNLVRYGQVQPSVATEVMSAEEGFEPDMAWWVWFAVRRLLVRFWSEPDTLPVPGDTVAYVVAPTAVVAVLVVLGLVRWPGARADLLLLLVPVALTLPAMLVNAFTLYAETGAPFGIHGRYLYHGIPGLMAATGAGAVVVARARPVVVPTVLLVALALQAVGLWLALATYWGRSQQDGGREAVAALLAWSPLPPIVLGAAAVVTLAAAGAAVVSASRALRRAGEEPAGV